MERSHGATERTPIGLNSWIVFLPKNCSDIGSQDEIIDTLWRLRPENPQYILIHGKRVEIPRRQLAMGRSYTFSGQTSEAIDWLPFVARIRDKISVTTGARFNGALLNFYSGPSQWIGPHSDSEHDLVPGEPVAVVSFGVPRRFRLTPREMTSKCERPSQDRCLEVLLSHGDVIVMGGSTQQTHKHEVRKPTKRGTSASDYAGKRVSMTFRVFA